MVPSTIISTTAMSSTCLCGHAFVPAADPAVPLQGKYDFKLLAVDVPTAARGEQRVFLEGDQRRYERGGIMSELRDPFLRALDARTQNAFEKVWCCEHYRVDALLISNTLLYSLCWLRMCTAWASNKCLSRHA